MSKNSLNEKSGITRLSTSKFAKDTVRIQGCEKGLPKRDKRCQNLVKSLTRAYVMRKIGAQVAKHMVASRHKAEVAIKKLKGPDEPAARFSSASPSRMQKPQKRARHSSQRLGHEAFQHGACRGYRKAFPARGNRTRLKGHEIGASRKNTRLREKNGL